jgi:TATA-box binding protein (TBP) (component of TFIID and TFIIIB)
MQYKSFKDITVSTKTFIVVTNLTVDVKAMYDILPITPYTIVTKKRGRKKKTNTVDVNKNIQNGSIITLDLSNEVRGITTKKKKRKDGTPNFFRNSMTVVMILDGKKVNFKITRNGRFQITGCKTDKQAEDCVKYIWEYIKDKNEGKDEEKMNEAFENLEVKSEQSLEEKEDTSEESKSEENESKSEVSKTKIKPKTIFTLPEDENFQAVFIPAMRNIDFSLGFCLNREKLNTYFNTKTNYYSLLDPSIGYTGVNIKIPIEKTITDLQLTKIFYTNKEQWKYTKIPYTDYLNTLPPKEQAKKLDKKRYITFLVFHSGKTICSAMCEEFAEDIYYKFVNIIKDNFDEFEERLTS